MRIDRLEKLITLLETDAANPGGIKFNMRVWGRPSNFLDGGMFRTGQTVPANCNTQACAFGLAAISGVFEDEGLSYEIEGGKINVSFEEDYGYGAACQLFEIALSDAERLFSPEYYANGTGAEAELEVAARIKQLIADGNLNDVSRTF